MPNYISEAEDVAAWRDELDQQGKKVVFTNGCFDLLHVGHVRYLREARELGDALVVALNSDASVRSLKGEGRPVNNAADRAEILRALEFVDKVVVFEEPRVTNLIQKVRPHIYTKGGDYTVDSLNPEERGALEDVGAAIEILSLVEGKSTSGILAKLESEEGGGSERLRIAVLGSGRGTNFQAIAEAVARGKLDAEIRMVISDVEDAGILNLAALYGVPHLFIHPGERRTTLSEASQKEIVDRLKAERVHLVVLAGFMRIVKDPLLSAFEGRIINIHPSLLPQFPGLESWRQALEAGVNETGCTVHIVDSGIDTGPILAQERVPVLQYDSVEKLHARIQEAEHRLLPRVIAEFGAKVLAGTAE